MITGQARFPELAAILGRPEINDDPRFATAESRTDNAKALIVELDIAFGRLTAEEVRAKLNEGGFTFGETHPITDVLNDEQMRAGGALRANSDPRGGADLVVDTPIFIDGVEKADPVMAPALGQHTDEILREAGYDEAEIARLKAEDAIG